MPIFLYLVYVFPTSGRGRYCQIFANFMDNLALNWLGDERFFLLVIILLENLADNSFNHHIPEMHTSFTLSSPKKSL